MPSSRARKTASPSPVSAPSPDGALVDAPPRKKASSPRVTAKPVKATKLAKTAQTAQTAKSVDEAAVPVSPKASGRAMKPAETAVPAPAAPAAKKAARKTASRAPAKTTRKEPPAAAHVVEPVPMTEPVPVVEPVPVTEPVSVDGPLQRPARKRPGAGKRTKADGGETPAPAVTIDLAPEGGPLVVVEPAKAPQPQPQRLWSELRLDADDAGRRLVWQAADDCPAALQAQGADMAGDTGAVGPQHDEALMALQAAAAALGHALRVDPAVWRVLAQARDVRWRVHHLEQAYPQGTASPALHALWPSAAGRLASFHYEGALFAACAGRCVLADEAALDPVSQALLAVQLFARHFGVERVLVVCPDGAVPQWRRARLQAGLDDAVQMRLGSSVPADGWSPELVIVDDTAAWPDAGTPAAVRALACTYAVVLMREPAERPQVLADWLAWLDGDGVGASRRFLQRHRADGATAWTGLDRLRDTLGALMLCRSRARWLQPVPGRRDRLVWLPADQQAREAQVQALHRLQPVVDRWRRVGYVSDVEQLGVHAALNDLRLATAPCAPQRLLALQALWADAATMGRALRIWAGSNEQAQRLTGALAAAGLPAHCDAATVVLSGLAAGEAALLDETLVCAVLPWPAAAGPVLPAGPVTYLLTEHGVDEHRLLLRCCDAALDAALADPVLFRQGAALQQRMSALGALVERMAQSVLRDAR